MAVFRIQPPPTGTLYSVLQKAKPGWSNKDLLKVYQKLQKVSITDGESLARAVSEGSLNNILAEAGEKRLKTSTLQLLRLASRDPARSKVNDIEELPHFRVPCQQHNDVLSMKLPSIRSLGPPPLMPSKRGDPRWKPKVMAALPRVKSEPILGKRRSPRTERTETSRSPGAGPKLVLPVVSHVGIMPPDWSRKALAPALPTVPEMPERILPPPKELRAPIEDGSAGHSGICSNSSSSFHSYGTFVEKQGQETFHHMEATYSSQESYAMTFEGSSDPAGSREHFAPDEAEELTASEQLHFEDESVEGTPSERTAGTQSMEATAVVDGLRDVLDANIEATNWDITLPSPKKQREESRFHRSDKAVDHCQQVAAQRRQQQRRHIIRAYG